MGRPTHGGTLGLSVVVATVSDSSTPCLQQGHVAARAAGLHCLHGVRDASSEPLVPLSTNPHPQMMDQGRLDDLALPNILAFTTRYGAYGPERSTQQHL